MPVGHFLGMVGALIWCPSLAKYLILKRSAEKDFGANTWECGTGRVDQGEDYFTALRREVREELGVEIKVDFILGTTHFYRGVKVPENEMLGVLYRCTLEDHDAIQLSWEHSEARWVTYSEASTLLSEGNWLLALIHKAEKIQGFYSPELINLNRNEGFEL
jgi:8-oxo-dGTP diphosphatase